MGLPFSLYWESGGLVTEDQFQILVGILLS